MPPLEEIMQIPDLEIHLGGGLVVRFPVVKSGPVVFPSSRIQKGPVLAYAAEDLSEEGVGFGVPVLKAGHETVYPGSVAFRSAQDLVVEAEYNLNIRERVIITRRPIRSQAFYKMNEWFSGLHRRRPFLRGFLKASTLAIRKSLDIKTKFEEGASFGTSRVTYSIDTNKRTIAVDLDLTNVRRAPPSEIFIMNELGGNFFTQYRDSDGFNLRQEAIGTWDSLRAEEASFMDPIHKVVFTLPRVEGARMYRGRELVPGRLAWAGLAYRLPDKARNFHYVIHIQGEGL